MNFVKKLVCTALVTGSVFAFAENAVVVSASGKVEVSRGGSWVQIAKDSAIKEGEIISTGFKSEALIKYKDSVMKLGPMTRVTLEMLASSEEKDSVSVFLTTGTVRSTVNHAQNKRVSYTVRNPIAVASVRGTDFDMDGLGNVECFEGGVAVFPAAMFDNYSETAEITGEQAPKEGKSNSFTNPDDINPNLKGGTLITGGQKTGFEGGFNSAPEAPKPIVQEKHEQVAFKPDMTSININQPSFDNERGDGDSNKATIIVNINWAD